VKSTKIPTTVIIITIGIFFVFSPIVNSQSFTVGNNNTSSVNSNILFNKRNLKTSQGDLLYSENFDDGVADNWEIIGGTWTVENGKYKVTDIYGDRVRSYNVNQVFSNYIYEGDFNLVSGNEMQIIFNIQDIFTGVDQGHYCQITLFYDDPYGRKDMVVLYSTQNGQTEHVNVEYDFTHNQWYHFSIISTGDYVDFFLNNSLILSFSGLFYSSGYIGVKSMFGPTAYWDNIVVSEIDNSNKIHINGNSDWIDLKNAGNCTGSGTDSDPYVLEDLVIDGGSCGDCIRIENSDMHFIISNYTVYNAGGYTGIRLVNVENGNVNQNNCSYNGNGISFEANCENIIIQGNIINRNTACGIILMNSYSNCIKENIITNSGIEGIRLADGSYNEILDNTINLNGWVGIELTGSNNNDISENYISGSSVGILISEESKCNTVSNNIFSSNGEDIQNFQGACSPVNPLFLIIGIILGITSITIIAGGFIIKRRSSRYGLIDGKKISFQVFDDDDIHKEKPLYGPEDIPIEEGVIETSEEVLVDGETFKLTVLYCRFCGTKINENKTFCTYCGTRFKNK
jgi:parallel beta-helix repeat protein